MPPTGKVSPMMRTDWNPKITKGAAAALPAKAPFMFRIEIDSKASCPVKVETGIAPSRQGAKKANPRFLRAEKKDRVSPCGGPAGVDRRHELIASRKQPFILFLGLFARFGSPCFQG